MCPFRFKAGIEINTGEELKKESRNLLDL